MLRVVIVAGKTFSCSHIAPLIKFRSAANTVLNVQRQPSETMLMMLLFSTCVPIMTYAIEVVPYSAKQIHSLNVALNDCIRRIFGYNRWENVRFLRISMGYPSITDIFHRRKANFSKKMPHIGNPTLHALDKLSLY